MKFKFSVLVVVEFKVIVLDVEAFETRKLDELPKRVARTALFADKFVNAAVIELSNVENKFVELELVIVPFVLLTLDAEILPAERLVSVALPALISALAIFVLAKLVVPVAFRFVVLRLASCRLSPVPDLNPKFSK